MEWTGKGGNRDDTATVLGECLSNLIQIYTVPLFHKRGYEFDIQRGKFPVAASLVGMRIMCSAVYAEVLKALIDKGFFDTQDSTDLIHSEVLLKKRTEIRAFKSQEMVYGGIVVCVHEE